VRILIVRPESDDVERTLGSWADRIRLELNRQPARHPTVTSTVDLSGGQVDRTAVEDAAVDADLLLFFCHGTDASLGTAPLVDGSNAQLTAQTVCVAAACQAATQLGSTAVALGAYAFIGYADLLVVLPGTRPDPLATAHKNGVATLVGGGTVAEAEDAIRRHYTDTRDRYLGALRGRPNSTIIWLAAHANQLALTTVGNSATTLA